MMLSEVMDGLADLIDMRNVYPFPAASITPPCALIGYPENVEFDLTFQRGGDTFLFPVWLIVGTSGTIDTRDTLSGYLSGVTSLKEALDGSHDFGSVRCTDAQISEVTVAGTTYTGIKISTEVVG
jgi:hypothetical protein